MKGKVIIIGKSTSVLRDRLLSLLCLLWGVACLVVMYRYLYKDILLFNTLIYVQAAVVMLPFALYISIWYTIESLVYLNPRTNCYKAVVKFGPVCIGKWRQLPEIEYVSVFKQTYDGGNGRANAGRGSYYDINLWPAVGAPVTLTQHECREAAIQLGRKIATGMHTGLLDATAPDAVWLIHCPPVATPFPHLYIP